MGIKGIDVSHWQGNINWKKVAGDGIKFAFIKATEGLKQAIKETIERMIKMKLEDEFIKQITGAKKEEIEKIRKEIEK